MKKVNWKKSRIITAILFVAVLFAVLAVNFSSFQECIINPCIGANARTSGFLQQDEEYRQYFRPAWSNLSYIEVKFATYTGADATGQICFDLLDKAGTKIASSTVPIKDLTDDVFYRFPVNMSLDPNSTYSFTLRPEGNSYEKSPTVWVSVVTGSEELRLSIPGSSTSSLYQSNAQYGYLNTDYNSLALCVALLLLGGFLIGMPFAIADKYKVLAGRVAVILSPAAMFFIVEALNDNSALQKITPAYFLNYLAYILIYLVLFAITNRLRISMIVANTVLYVLAMINYFKLMFRGEPLQPWDFFSAGTAMNVAGNYVFSFSAMLFVCLFSFIVLNLSLMHVELSMKRIRTRVLTGALSAALSTLMVVSLFGTDRYAIAAFSVMQHLGIVNNVWNQPSNYAKNGLVVALTMNAQYMNVDVPDGYDADKVAQIKSEIESGTVSSPETAGATTGSVSEVTPASEPEATSGALQSRSAAATETVVPNQTSATTHESAVATANVGTQESAFAAASTGTQDQTAVKPNIIAIMCESFADLQSISDFQTNTEVMPFIDSLTENTIKGQAYVSTYGGGTANSEFEFLTGNSMAFLPTGSIPYQQYIDEPTGSLAWILKNQGYSTAAVHPFEATGWNRPSVYEAFGFDQFLSMEDFTAPKIMRSYISDESSYAKLIELYEAKPKGQPIFLFNVTMQNHGGYIQQEDNFDADIKIEGMSKAYPETEEYLSLAHQSDAALRGLINYFSTVDEPTVIVFFGDHLPNLKNDFYNELFGKDLSTLSSEDMVKLYRTPFVLWANYDIPEKSGQSMSLNYLSTLVLEMAGLPLPDYNVYLSQLFSKYPVINAMDIETGDGKVYGKVSELPDPSDVLRYSILSYNNLFDKNGRDATIFDSTCPLAQANAVMFDGSPDLSFPANSITPTIPDVTPPVASGYEAGATTAS